MAPESLWFWQFGLLLRRGERGLRIFGLVRIAVLPRAILVSAVLLPKIFPETHADGVTLLASALARIASSSSLRPYGWRALRWVFLNVFCRQGEFLGTHEVYAILVLCCVAEPALALHLATLTRPIEEANAPWWGVVIIYS